MSITVCQCDHNQLIDHISALTVGHWQETEAGFSDRAPDPDRIMYDAIAAAGGLVSYAAFDGEQLIGYASAFVCRHPHYPMVIAQHDTLYLHPEHRKGTAGVRLMKALEEEAKERGAERMLWHAKGGSTFEHILQGRGCHTEESVYCKEL